MNQVQKIKILVGLKNSYYYYARDYLKCDCMLCKCPYSKKKLAKYSDNELEKYFNTEKLPKLHEIKLYLDDIYYTEIHFIYINTINNIEKIKEEHFLLSTPNYISREEIIGLLKRNTIENNKKYSILSILKCNINLKPEDIKNFLKSKNLTDYLDNFLVPIKNIDAI